MSIFSKLGKSISKGFSTGLSSGFQNLSDKYDEERQLRTRQSITTEGAFDRNLFEKGGPTGRGLAYQHADRDTGELHVYTTPEINNMVEAADSAVTKAQSQYLLSPGERGVDVPDKSVTLSTVNEELLNVNRNHDAITSYLNTHSKWLSNEQKNELQNQQKILAEEQKKLAAYTGKIIKRDTPDPVLQKELAHYSAVATGEGYNLWQETLNAIGGSPDYLDFKGTQQRLSVVEGLMGQAGGFRKARQFVNKYGMDDSSFLMQVIDNGQAAKELGIIKNSAMDLIEKATGQREIQHAYDMASKEFPEGPEKEIEMRKLFDRSLSMIEQQNAAYNQYIEDAAVRIAGDMNRYGGRRLQFEGDDPLARLAVADPTSLYGKSQQVAKEKVQPEAFNAFSPQVREMAIRQANAQFPHMATRRKYNNRLIGGLTIPDVVAIAALQQVNVGSTAQVGRESILEDQSLTQEERVKALQLFESVGGEIGFDVLAETRDDLGTLTAIHQGFPAWWDQKTVIEDRLFEAAQIDIEAAVSGKTRSGRTLETGPQNEIQSIDEARLDLEQREMTGMIPVGASKRIFDRLSNHYMGTAEMDILVDVDEEPASSPQPEVAEDSPENLKSEYDRIIRENPGITAPGGEGRRAISNLTSEEQEIVQKYRSMRRGKSWQRISSAIELSPHRAGSRTSLANRGNQGAANNLVAQSLE
jgi:hypothetical protein